MIVSMNVVFFCFKQKTAYDMRISDWSSDVCSSDLHEGASRFLKAAERLCEVREVEMRPGVGLGAVQVLQEEHGLRRMRGAVPAAVKEGDVSGPDPQAVEQIGRAHV